MPRKGIKAVIALSALLAVAACAENAQPNGDGGERIGLPNPASVNCAKLGGRSVPERRPDGGAYGVCLFEDNRQCEEWALFRGECPPGGVRVTGYVTEAGRYCAITGGSYRVTAQAEITRPERGICTLVDGRDCDADDYFAGICR